MLKSNPTLEADLLIVGGGIGGLMAAITAAKHGASVLVTEKCHSRRSGSGATGNDHFNCYIPEFHGDDMGPVFEQTMHSMVGAFKEPAIIHEFLEHSFDLVKQWEAWGIGMRPSGEWEFRGHALPGKPRCFLKYDGRDQKKVLVREARAAGAKFLNHHPVVELSRLNGRVCGALALDCRAETPAFQPIRAKAVLVATGLTHRLYLNAATPASMFNTSHCPNCAGGQGLGWRAGAKLVNMELPYTHAGPKYFQRAGKATWIGVYRYLGGRPVGPFATASDPTYGDVTSDIWNTVFEDVFKKGTGPAFMDCSDASKEQLDYMRWAMTSEGLTALLHYMEAKGIDPARHGVEFMRYEPVLHGRGFDVDSNGQTSVPGLYAAGDVVGNAGCGIALASYMGWRGGLAAAETARTLDHQSIESDPALLQRMELLSAVMDRPNGADWKDANLALQQIMSDYAPAGPHRVRSATLLRSGIQYLGNLRRSIEQEMGATCSHTLMRAAETLDLLDCGEAILHAAMARQETRGNHIRADFPFTNPLHADQFLTVGLEDGQVTTGWRAYRKP